MIDEVRGSSCSLAEETSDSVDSSERVISYSDLSRREVRSLIFHILYSMEAFDSSISLSALIDNYNRGFNLDIPEDSDVFTVSKMVIDQRDKLDDIIKPLLDNWRFDRIGMSTKLILRFAIWELLNTDTSPEIIINEAIELAKCFAEADAYKFVNGILDKVAKSLEK